ncbi:LrgB family protein [Stappia sp. ES.058]|uniref:LrgB family protein n=1 Tax=Stappia sp. ES.058 TaxID=1881061 RepID=UPI000879ED2D|nr:LrgB family protein [Stappia sp. ES.058]SDU22633.1 TIGR00659 family protein [Stappia sp. ES.058]
MTTPLTEVWVYLSASPLAALTLTLLAYQAGFFLYRRAGFHPLVNPVLIAVAIIAGLLLVSGTSYATYFDGAQFVHFLLGPATVALALPLYRQLDKVRRSALAILTSLLAGSLTAAVSAVGVAMALDASRETLASLAPKSVTAPVAMGISEALGGLPSLTAVLVILTGILGAAFGPLVLDLLRIRDWRARGFAIGVASHGIGTSRALQVNETAGAFSGLAMGLNAVATAVLLPLIWRLFF